MNTSATMIARKSHQRPNRQFVGVTTEELLLDLSRIRQDRLDTIEDPELEESTRANTLAYLEYHAAPIIQEVKRRHDQHERHKNDPKVGAWPSADRYQKSLEAAKSFKESIPLSTYINYTLPSAKLTKSGNRWKGHCPFHEDRTPSLVIFDDIRFTCFGCGVSGDIFTIVELVDGLERFTDQVKSLASWAGLAVSS